MPLNSQEARETNERNRRDQREVSRGIRLARRGAQVQHGDSRLRDQLSAAQRLCQGVPQRRKFLLANLAGSAYPLAGIRLWCGDERHHPGFALRGEGSPGGMCVWDRFLPDSGANRSTGGQGFSITWACEETELPYCPQRAVGRRLGGGARQVRRRPARFLRPNRGCEHIPVLPSARKGKGLCRRYPSIVATWRSMRKHRYE